MSTVISCSKHCHISYYIAVCNSWLVVPGKKGLDLIFFFFFIEKHGYIYLACYYKYSSSRLWPGEFQACGGQWKFGTWFQWSQDFHWDFWLFGELELTMTVDKNLGKTQHLRKEQQQQQTWFSHFCSYQIMILFYFSNIVKVIQTTQLYVLLGTSFESLPVVICVMIGSRSPSHR